MPKRQRKLNLPASVLYDAKNRKYGPGVTVILAVVLLLLVSTMWALFISGPARLHEEQQAQIRETIEQEVPGIQGVTEHIFDYVTYNGYTDDTLYWFDQTGEIITTRAIETLDYEKAKQTALDSFNIEADTIQLAFGYNMPCYEIEGSGQLLLLDYDTLVRVYQRSVE